MTSTTLRAGKKWPDYFKGRLFWIGFGIAFGIIGWNMISYFQPTWPRISMSPNKGLFYFARIFPPLLTHINTYTIGFGYFVKLEILFSIWFFHFLLMSEIALIRKTGFQFGRMHQSGGGWGDPLVQWQCLGALFVFVAWGFWAARHHLRDVFRKAFFNECGVDDSREMLSYRTAVIGFIAGNLYIVAWLHQAGIELALLAITVPASIIIYIALARFVCESGTLYLGLPTSPLDMGYQILGTETISARVLTASATSHALRWMYFMPALSQGAKAIDRVKGNRRVLFWAVLGGLLTALAVNIWMVLYLGYKYGAFNFHGVSVHKIRAAPLRRRCREYQIAGTGLLGTSRAVCVRRHPHGGVHAPALSPAVVAAAPRGFHRDHDQPAARNHRHPHRLAVQSHCHAGWRRTAVPLFPAPLLRNHRRTGHGRSGLLHCRSDLVSRRGPPRPRLGLTAS